MQTNPDNSPNEAVTAHAGAHVNITRIELPPGLERLTSWFLPTVLMLTAVIGACGVVMGANIAEQRALERSFNDDHIQGKLLERRYMDMEAYAILNGWKIPGDDTHGPTGNIQRMKPTR
jgi:hypothetical protein